MADSTVGSLERLLEDLVRRAVENSLASFQQAMRKEIQEAIGRGGATAPSSMAAAATPATTAASASVLPAVNQAVARVLQPTGQSEIMAAALQSAASLGGRCALFVKRGDSFSFWRAEGFPGKEASQLRSVSASASQPGAFKEICDHLLPVSGPRSASSLPEAMLGAVGGAGGDSFQLLPVVVQGRVVAALYADSGGAETSIEPAALEILARVAGLSLETAAGRAASGIRPAMAPAEAPLPAPPTAAAAPVEAPPPAAVVPAVPPPPDPETLPAEDRDAHRKAYRTARVAVQDLLAYPQNQAKIEEGRKNRTLYRLLKEEIDKNRETYQKRFGQTAARSFDYLHYELVTKLAENDPEKLGSEYPGAVPG